MAKKSATKRAAPGKSRSSPRPAPRAAKQKAAKQTAAKRLAARKTTQAAARTVRKPAKTARLSPLGRPKVTGEELLYMLFKEDFHARNVFEFLGVQTVKELEKYSPQQIVGLLTRPITQTVERIRTKLAEKNRYLLDDVEFARTYQQQVQGE
ncbi:MAG: hypothetical protein AB7F89_02400 [Pirellulaceae bacterium]